MIENVFFYIFCVVFGSKIFVRAAIILIKTASHLCMPHSLTQIPALSAFLTICHKMVTLHESPHQNDTLGIINEYSQLDAHLKSHKYRQEDRAAVLMPASHHFHASSLGAYRPPLM